MAFAVGVRRARYESVSVVRLEWDIHLWRIDINRQQFVIRNRNDRQQVPMFDVRHDEIVS